LKRGLVTSPGWVHAFDPVAQPGECHSLQLNVGDHQSRRQSNWLHRGSNLDES
jgi:hypothetical protein